MKIGILTFSKANNIGALLQAYALQEYLSLDGVSVKHIDFKYKAKNMTGGLVAKKTNSVFFSKFVQFKLRYINRVKRNKFEGFRRSYIQFDSEAYTDSIPHIDSYDVYIAGSDQIWNTDLNGDCTEFYLDFTSKPKYTYSASVGRDLTDRDKERILSFASSFAGISAREQDLCDYVTESAGCECTLTVDPVFLLEKSRWEKVESKVRTPKKYVFAYVMEDTEQIREALTKTADRYGARIVWVSGGGKQIVKFPGKRIEAVSPEEFLYLIDHSCAVVTNSFHGAAFASIMQKPLCIVSHTTRNARLVQLVHNIAHEDKIVYSNEIDDIERHMISSGENHIQDLIDDSKKYLLRIIEQERKAK